MGDLEGGKSAARELRMLYRLEAESIEGLRRGRWAVLFYALLVDLLILVAVRPLVGAGDFLKPVLVSAFSLLVLIFSLWFLTASRRDLSEVRRRLAEIAGSFSEPLRRLYPLEEPGEARRDDAPLLILQAGVLTAGWFVTNLMLYELEPLVVFILLAFSVYVWLVSTITILSAP